MTTINIISLDNKNFDRFFVNLLPGSPIGCRIYTSRILLTESFMTTIEELYNALTTQEVCIVIA